MWGSPMRSLCLLRTPPCLPRTHPVPLPVTTIRLAPEHREYIQVFMRICRQRPDDIPFIVGVMEALLAGSRVIAEIVEDDQ